MKKNWIRINYEKLSDGSINDYIIFPQFLYTYSGTLYLIAYNPKRKLSTNFAIQNINSIEEHYDSNLSLPDFDYEAFRKTRFAVNDGTIHDIKLIIKPEFVKYFENRTWHVTQKTRFNSDGSYMINMKVPISNELVSWITRWCQAFIDIEPTSLKRRVLIVLDECSTNLKKRK